MSTRELLVDAVLNPGVASATVEVLDTPLNFWGGFDPDSGRITDIRHPQHGVSLAGRLIVMPPSRGSGTNAQIFAQACASGHGPAGVVVTGRDLVVAVGAIVARRLYSIACPVVSISAYPAQITPGSAVSILERDEHAGLPARVSVILS